LAAVASRLGFSSQAQLAAPPWCCGLFIRFFMASSSSSPAGLVSYRLRAELRGHASDVRAVVALPGGGFATGSRDATVCVWEPQADGSMPAEPTRLLNGHDHFVVSLALLPCDGRALLASGSSDKSIRIWYVLR